jgi:alpha-tubulin suppressor-like RCC1 family protein
MGLCVIHADVRLVCQRGLAMVIRLFASLSKVFTAAALMALGIAAGLQVATAVPATAAGSTVGVFAWGDNSSGELGDGNTTNSSTPLAVSLPPGVTPTAIAGGGGQGDPQPSQFAGYAIGSDGHLYAWGDNSRGALGNGDSPNNSSTPVVVSLPSGITPTAIAASQGTGYAIGSDGHLYAWGDNSYGTLGNGTSVTFSDTPVMVSLPIGVTPVAIAGGFETGYAIGSDGHLYAWGDNFYGELGNGLSPTNSSTPVLVSLPTGVTAKAIAGGGGFALAIGSDGHLYSWGLNSNGALGDGSTINSTTPVLVSLPSGVTPTAIAGGGAAAYAIGSDGHLYSWGLNSSGQLGNGSNTDSSTPVLVSLPSGVTPSTIAAGSGTGAVGSGGAAYAIGSDGHLYAWGNDNDGQLGDGSNTNSSTPILVSLPPGSTLQKLAPESGSASGYAIVNTPNAAPTVTTQPVSQTVTAGQGATFTAAASGFPTPTVQWQVSTDHGATFSPVSGSTTGTLTITATTTAENGNEYEAVFTNGSGSATTNPATLTVPPPVAPTITTQPTDQTVSPGQIATFTAGASGSPTPTVQWQVSYDGGTTWSDIVGNSTSNSTTLSGPIYGTFENGWQVRAVFSNAGGTATTNPATLTVPTPVAPTITIQPTDQTISPGQIATFSAGASGSPTPTAQWQISYDGGTTWSDIVGNSTSNTTMLSGVVYGTFENGWQVRAVFSNAGGTATTNPATLTVP